MNFMQSMMVISSTWNDKPTFKLLPTTPDCPYVEGIYDADKKVLAVIGKTLYKKPHMMPKLDNHGRPKTIKGKNADGQLVEMQTSERIFSDAFYEYYLEDEEDIRSFITTFTSNPTHKALGIINGFTAEKKKTAKKKETAKA